MKYLIASDIHGSEKYCRLLLEAYARERADRLILLGDLLYHGPRNDLPEEYGPKQVIELLNKHAAELLCVRGNCEAEVDQMVLRFPVMAEFALLNVGSRLIYMTHGHHANADNPPPLQPGDVLLCGHTHVPACEQRCALLYCNPGSVAIPKDGAPHSYMTLDAGSFLWKTLEGTVFLRYDIEG